jgi:proteasome assembly chaperone 3
MAPPPDYEVVSTPFPARTKTSSASIAGLETTATTVYFADKIVITIAQNGRLGHWVHVPLDINTTDNPFSSNTYSEEDSDLPPSTLLPSHHLTATSILGGTVQDLDTLGQLLATQLTSAIMGRDSNEKRMVVVGMGLDKSMAKANNFSDVVGLALSVL